MVMALVDHRGNPIDMSALREEIATAEVTGIRQIWHSSVAAGMTPAALVALLERSVHDDPIDYLTLAEEIEERDGHYFSVLATRKLAVESIDVVIEAASDDAQDVKIADAVRELCNLECVQASRADLLDGLGKSYSVCEILWDTSERQWQPLCIPHRDPRWFKFDRDTGRELRMRDAEDAANGIPLAPFKFIVHKPRLKSGLPIRNGLARIAAFSWLCKAYALKDWLAFAEVFGMPVRVGKWSANATEPDKRALRRAVANIGTDAAAVMPDSMKIEFIETANRAGGGDLFEKLCGYLDRQLSKVVLGQTMTTEAQATGLGSNNASVHNEVRGDIRDADSGQLAATYQRDLVKPYVDLNYGPQKHYPKVVIRKREPEDINQLTTALERLVPLGLRVEQSVVRDKLSLPDPEPDAEVLTPPGALASPAPSVNHSRVAFNRTRPADLPQLLADQLAVEARSAHRAWIDSLREMAERAETLEQLRDMVLNAYSDLSTDQLAEVMAQAFTLVEARGREDVATGAGPQNG
jgi:phage gp29-like protein